MFTSGGSARNFYALNQRCILWKILPLRGKYQPMSFEGKIIRRGREKEGKCKRKKKRGERKRKKGEKK